MRDKKPFGKTFLCFGPKQDSEFLVGPDGTMARRGTPQAESLLKSRATTPRPVAPAPTSKSKLQAIEPIPEETQSQEKAPVAVECNHMKTAPTNSSFVDLINDPAFRWTLLYILLAVLIYCLWPRGEYVSMGNSLILNKRTGEVHRACDRIKK